MIFSEAGKSVGNELRDFYNYACGGYIKETDLSWFKNRVRESPDEIVQEHRKYIIDRLSASFDRSDDRLMATSKEIFRSCLLRPGSSEEGTKTIGQ
ncbi:neprilysin-2 [Biomphalaria glabrata]|nr:neprilysin-2 [Biomphalaria glabrata]